jgi:hypothetical protein
MIAATCGTLTNRVARPRSGISLARFLLGLVIYEETLSNSIMLARAVVLSASRVSRRFDPCTFCMCWDSAPPVAERAQLLFKFLLTV